MPKRRAVATFLFRGALLATIAVVALGAQAFAQPFRLSVEDFPNTSFPAAGHGAPYLVMYDDGDFLASASYRYSQRNHDSPWLVVNFQIARSERAWNLELRREDIVLIRPDGLKVPPATQRERRGDPEGLWRLQSERANWPSTVRFDFSDLPRARTQGGYYFLRPNLQLQGRDTRFGEVLEERDDGRVVTRVTRPNPISDSVFFVSPDGSWETGVHALFFTVDDDRIIKLPVWLQ